mgnify:CR=1 FL=1
MKLLLAVYGANQSYNMIRNAPGSYNVATQNLGLLLTLELACSRQETMLTAISSVALRQGPCVQLTIGVVMPGLDCNVVKVTLGTACGWGGSKHYI